MPRREGTVYLVLFITVLILFAVASAAFFVQYNDSEGLRKEAVQGQERGRVVDR